MTTKVISIVTAATALTVYLWSQLQPSGALPLFASANIFINLVLLALAAGLVRLSFAGRFKTAWGYTVAAAGAAGCLLFGGAGIVFSSLDYGFYTIFGPLDFLLLAEAGVILSICVLSYKHQPVKSAGAGFKLPRSPIGRPDIVLPRLAFDSLKSLRLS